MFTIVFEDHDYAEVVGSADAPYINSLIAQYGLATNYFDSFEHPSVPNYLYLVSGDTQYPGVLDVPPTQSPFPVDSDNLGEQLTDAGIAWRSYQEGMGTACKLTASGEYTPDHDPFLYFDDIQNGPGSLCVNTNVDYSQFAADLDAGTYRYMWITPNLLDDGHDPANDAGASLQHSDSWLASQLPAILASPAYQAGGVVFITWDEAAGRLGDSPDQVPMIIISPRLVSAGYTSNKLYGHASYLATVEVIFGLPRLGAAATAPDMMEFFGP